MPKWVAWLQRLLAVAAIGIIVVFFVSNMVTPPPAGGEANAPTVTSTPNIQSAPPVGGDTPGVPDVPVAEHETWPEADNKDVNRQLDVTASAPAVELPEALGDDVSAYWNQTLTWTSCGGGECTTMKVPMDWENPGKAALDIAVIRIPSANPSEGPLFVNPGGPGASGMDYARSLKQDAWEGYDIVGWDPRGSGESTHVQCGTTEETDAAYSADGTPDDDAERIQLSDAWAAFAQQCRQASGELLDHISTIENVRDLDLLRFLLGAEKLNYLGVSYGTYIGAMYAELFPSNTGRMVLDSAVNITDDDSVSQFEGFELALNNYADWCAQRSNCSLGDSREVIISKINDFLHGLDSAPLQVGDRMLTQGYAATGVAMFLYSGANVYPTLTEYILAGMEGNGEPLLRASDALNSREDSGWDTSAFAFPAIRCLDGPDQGIEGAYTVWEEIVPKSPVFAGNMGVDLVCELWTAASVPTLKLTGKSAAPILVVGSTGDSATPYEHAVTMAEQLESAVLLTYDGPGHGAVSANNACVDDAIAAYLKEGVVPDDGTICTN